MVVFHKCIIKIAECQRSKSAQAHQSGGDLIIYQVAISMFRLMTPAHCGQLGRHDQVIGIDSFTTDSSPVTATDCEIFRRRLMRLSDPSRIPTVTESGTRHGCRNVNFRNGLYF